MTAFGAFAQIRIINLVSRPDRRREMEGELKRLGILDDPRVKFVDGVVVDDPRPFRLIGEHGVFLSHLKILAHAAATASSVLILEDDADFTHAAAIWSPASECDIAYGGYSASNPDDLVRSDIIGAHCMGFSAGAAAALAPYLEQLLVHESPPPIDGAYVWFRRASPSYRVEFAVPPVAVQRPSRSDIAGPSRFDRIRSLGVPLSVARWLKRRYRRGI